MRWTARMWMMPLLATASLAAAETPVTGGVRMDYFSSSRHLDDDRDVFGATFELKTQHSFSEQQRVEFEARLTSADIGGDAEMDHEIASAFWFVRRGPLDVRIGQQRLRWGKADVINPADFFTGVNYTVALPLEGDRYRSSLGVRADVALTSAQNLSLIVTPDFNPSKLPWPDEIPTIDHSPKGRRHPQVGLRWSHTGESLDYSLMGFDGFQTLPVLAATTDSSGAVRFERRYPEIHGFGADAAANFGQWGARAELAYTSMHGRDAQSLASNWFFVGGVDRAFGDYSINLQALLRYTPEANDPHPSTNAAQPFADSLNEIIHGQYERFTYGVSSRFAASWLNQTLQAELLVIGYFEPRNWLLRPLLNYALNDDYRVLLGGEYYMGPDDSYFGLLKRNRTLFLELQRHF